MMRTTATGEKKFCYGLFFATLLMSAIAGLAVSMFWVESETSQRMVLWTSAALGGNLGPLLVDLGRRVFRF